jgi:hypothetical protein
MGLQWAGSVALSPKCLHLWQFLTGRVLAILEKAPYVARSAIAGMINGLVSLRLVRIP